MRQPVYFDAGADVNAKDKEKRTPLDYAVCPDQVGDTRIETVRALLKAGAEPGSEDHTSLDYLSLEGGSTVFKGTQLEAARLLIKAGANPGKMKKDFGPDAMDQLKEMKKEYIEKLEQELLSEDEVTEEEPKRQR